MPTYEYVCESCGHEFELVQKMTDPPRKRCPKCGKKVQRKIGSGAGIIFKGSGFYATDYRKPEYKNKEQAEKPSGGTGGSGKKGTEPSSSGTKPAEKKDAAKE